MKKFFILIAAIMGFVACDNRHGDMKEAIINDTSEMFIKGHVAMSSFIEVKNVIPLETSDASLLGSIEKIVKCKGLIFVKSKGKPLTLFDGNGHFLNTIGSIGIGPEEYPLLSDFDICEDAVYVLTVDKIQVYRKNGEWLKSIPISLNASGLHLIPDGMLLFVLGDKHVVHKLNRDGKEEKSTLRRNQTLRLNRAVSFVRYGEKVLFPMGRSNELLSYDMDERRFGYINYLESNDLTNEKEAVLMEEASFSDRQLQDYGFFDGLLANETHIIFPFIKGEKSALWVKNIQQPESWAYFFSSLENDVTFVPVFDFFRGNVQGDSTFLTYVMPYRLKESLEKVPEEKRGVYWKRMENVLKQTDEEANPIVVEYIIRK